MTSEGSGLPNALHCSLQKCFRALQEQHEAWKRALSACTPFLSSLANLAEQMQASQKVSFANTPLQHFPSLPERLRHKQQCAMEALLEELQQDKLGELQNVRDAVAVQVAGVFALAEQHFRTFGCESSFHRSALSPSLADMLEWLQDIDRFYHHTYLEVKLLLSQVRYENLLEIQALPKAWEQVQQQEHQNTVEDVLLKVSFLEAA